MTTIREAILTYPGTGEGESFLDTVLIDRSLNGAADYAVTYRSSVQLAAADIYAMIGGLPDFTENKLSITYPRAWYTQKARELYIANGEPEKAKVLGNSIRVPRGRASQSW